MSRTLFLLAFACLFVQICGRAHHGSGRSHGHANARKARNLNPTCKNATEQLNTCGNVCERKCGQPEGRPCEMVCAPPACECKAHLHRHPDGNCVAEADCPNSGEPGPVCDSETEQLNPCGNFCEGVCGEESMLPCEMSCVEPMCECKLGFKRHIDGNCVLESECTSNDEPGAVMEITLRPTPTCDSATEDLNPCGNSCETRCGVAPYVPCEMSCVEPKCVCKLGLMRNEDGDCVEESDDCEAVAPPNRHLPVLELPTPPPTPTCDADTEYVHPCGNACERQCNVAPFVPCEMSCLAPICVCNEGLMRNEAGDCVEESDECEAVEPPSRDLPVIEIHTPPTPTCDADTEYVHPCGNACERQCNVAPFVPCEMSCLASICVCNEGLMRNEAGDCVEESDECEAVEAPIRKPILAECASGEVVNGCGNQCERKCGQPENMPCMTICNPPACECGPGFARSESDGQCVPLDECPSTSSSSEEGDSSSEAAPDCGENESLNSCGNHCESDCTVNNGGPKPCTKICKPPACACVQGYARHEGACVAKTECPGADNDNVNPTCNATEQLNNCGNVCERKCGMPADAPCILICAPPACECTGNLLRHPDGNCVAEAECPDPDGTESSLEEISCGEHESVNACGNHCERDCTTNNGGLRPCLTVCNPPACACDEGYARLNGECVAITECPRTTADANGNADGNVFMFFW